MPITTLIHRPCLLPERLIGSKQVRQRCILVELVERLRVSHLILDALLLKVIGSWRHWFFRLLHLFDLDRIPVNSVHAKQAGFR